ncbi:MAG TPA: FHA domain-containing protein [Rhizomicrobium sp.]
MSFVLRTIARRVGAPDIVRTRDVTATEPVVGRGSDCDIQLTDLAVSLRHAVLRPIGASKVIAQALGDEKFEANGIFVKSAELDVAKPAVLGFGSHVLTLTQALAPGEQPGQIMITVTARENAVATDAAADQKGAFSLKHALFSQRWLAWTLSVLIVALCLALPIGVFIIDHNRQQTIVPGAHQQWSSGPLSPGHHFLEKNCVACHQHAFVSVRDDACLSCHKAGLDKDAAAHLASDLRGRGSPFPPDPAPDHAPRDRLMAARPPDPDFVRRINGWVAETFSHPNNRCASCHTEHVGNGQVEAANAPKPVTPDEIKRNDCKDCHTDLKSRLPDTKIADAPDWGHHPDFSPVITTGFNGDKPVSQRIALSAMPMQKTGLIFGHDVHLKTGGLVARMARDLGKTRGYGAPLDCADCHRAAPDGGFAAIDMPRDCEACHSLVFDHKNGVEQRLPHGKPKEVMAALKAFYAGGRPEWSNSPATFLGRPGLRGAEFRPGPAVDPVAAAARAAFQPGGTCTTCHTVTPPAGTLDYGIAPVHLTTRYLPWGEFNHNISQHRQDALGASTCRTCHKVETSAKSEDVMLPKIAECAACHGKTRPQTSAAAGADCAECHGFHNPGTPATGRQEQLAKNALIRTQ